HESIVAVHSVNTSPCGGGVHWYEFGIGKSRSITLYQQGDLFLLAVRGPREGEQIVGKRRRFVGNEEIAFAHEQKRNAHEEIAFPHEQKRNAYEEKQFPDYRRRLSTTSAGGRAKPCTRWFHLAVFTISYETEDRKGI